jgi:hypothetical protein
LHSHPLGPKLTQTDAAGLLPFSVVSPVGRDVRLIN